MRKHYPTGLIASFCAAAVFLIGSQGWAAHDRYIHLKDADGAVIGANSTKAFSIQKTCNTVMGCHDVKAIERHSYHAQLGGNQHLGWDPFKYGNWNSVAPKKKPWVQSPGHVGKW